MFKFNPFRRDASGFTKKDDRIAMEYVELFNAATEVRDEDPARADILMAQAEMFLQRQGWTQEQLDAVLDHFHPAPVVYTDVQVAASGAALDAFNVGDEAAALAVLSEHGLTVHDVKACRKQYWDQLARPTVESE